MLLLYYTHPILYYLSLPAFQTNDGFTKHLHAIDCDYLPQEVCVAKCLQRRNQTVTNIYNGHLNSKQVNHYLKICLNNCTLATEGHNPLPPKQIHDNYRLNLVCRDDTSLNFKIDLQTAKQIEKFNRNQSMEFETILNATAMGSVLPTSLDESNEIDLKRHEYGTLFVIRIHLANDAEKFSVYLSDDNFFTINQLVDNTTYNISILAVHSNNKYSVISQQLQFKTLHRSYTPGNVTEFEITHFREDAHNKMHLAATLTWKPAADMTCHYDIICFSPDNEDYDMQPLEIRNPRQLYKHQLENLKFSSVYKVGIRSSDTKGERESELFWKTFTVPSCVQWYNYNFDICAPETLQNLNIVQKIIDLHKYSLNISWDLPSHLPENYTLHIYDLSAEGNATIYNLPKHINNYFIKEIPLYGMFYEASLTAYTGGGHTTTTFTDITKTGIPLPEKNPFVKLIAVLLAPILCVLILSLTILIIYRRREKLKRYQKRCKYFEELEKEASLDPNNTLDFTANLRSSFNELYYQIEGPEHLLYDDKMEIDSNDLMLQQVLGEGAFGLVKLGLYTDRISGTTQQVAVKMLKDRPSAEDIYAFRREIDVMKSVEKHPNIVGIIGHCTRFSNQMMLITEYCSLGNLLNFLRDEWHFQHKMQIKDQCNDIDIAYIDLNQDDSLPQSVDAENSKDTLQHVCGAQGDGNVLIKYHNVDNDVIEYFKTKCNDSDVTKMKTAFNNNHNCNPHYENSTNISQTVWQQVENLTITKTVHENPPSNYCFPAVHNKSYAYTGFCTNCSKTIVTPEIEKQMEELQSVGNEQQLSIPKVQPNFNKNCTESTIQIKNFDWKPKENLSKNKFNRTVENKTYLELFTVDNQHLSCKNRQNIVTTKTENSIKQPASNGCEIDLLNRNYGDVDVKEVHTTSSVKRVPLLCADLLNIARQVAVGMEFLAKNKVVHRDLAARNVLVAPDRTIKIADFGLSRDVYQENMYKRTGNGKLPIKWLALESMTHQVYTNQSDVWSYGILLYEIITLGATPYPSIPMNRLLDLLKSGYRMEKPKGCCQEFYDLMHSCWNAEPIARPTFHSIVLKLNDMLHCLDNSKDMPTIYYEMDKHFSEKKEIIQNNTNDDSYLKPL